MCSTKEGEKYKPIIIHSHHVSLSKIERGKLNNQTFQWIFCFATVNWQMNKKGFC